MTKRTLWVLTSLTILLVLPGVLPRASSTLGQAPPASAQAASQPATPILLPEEKHLRNVRQLTFGGENAEAYFSADDKWISFQHRGAGEVADQIYIMDTEGKNRRMVSTGKGRTTCSYIFPGNKKILFASTHGASPDPLAPPDMSRGYVWKLYPEFEIYTANFDGTGLKQLTNNPGYDAEATIRRDGKKIVFTSKRDGNVDIYTMDPDGRNLKRLTHETGYNGGPFFSFNGKMIVYRASRPKTPEEMADYKELIEKDLLRPTRLEIFVMKADGSNKRQLTNNGAANFAPFFHPDGKRVIFASNMENPRGRNFDLYMIRIDGTGLERITFSPEFDSFPMFTSDGKKLIWASNRNARVRGETNLFLADWVE